jgi:hypothetical protein
MLSASKREGADVTTVAGCGCGFRRATWRSKRFVTASVSKGDGERDPDE